MYKAVQSSRLYEQIVKQIEESILKGALKAGDQLPAERELAQQFGVSRTAVREAVKTLREKGLVESYSGRGTFITNGTSQAIKQSLDFMMRIGQQDGLAQLQVPVAQGQLLSLECGQRKIRPLQKRRNGLLVARLGARGALADHAHRRPSLHVECRHPA